LDRRELLALVHPSPRGDDRKTVCSEFARRLFGFDHFLRGHERIALGLGLVVPRLRAIDTVLAAASRLGVDDRAELYFIAAVMRAQLAGQRQQLRELPVGGVDQKISLRLGERDIIQCFVIDSCQVDVFHKSAEILAEKQ